MEKNRPKKLLKVRQQGQRAPPQIPGIQRGMGGEEAGGDFF